MDTQQQQFDVDFYTQALDEAPESVRNFLWSDEYTQMVSAVATHFGIAEQEKKLSDTIFDIIIGYDKEDAAREKLSQFGIPEEKLSDLTSYIYEFFIQPIVTTVESQVEIPEEISEAPSPADVLQSLKTRLTTPGAIAPVSRELPQATQQHTQDKQTIDPYREIPS